jgi:saccharopine dehydrogenase-like NADP-dependent oxidoreductase
MSRKVLIIGAGGIGSYLIEILNRTDCYTMTVADPDKYEDKNLTYQLCTVDEVGENKASATTGKYHNVKNIKYPILTEKQIQGYELVVCCADNLDIRRLLYRSKVEWLDLRAQGRNCAFVSYRADPKLYDTLLAGPEGSFSCQGNAWDGSTEAQHFSHIIAAGMGAEWVHRFFVDDEISDFKMVNV